MEWQNIHFVMMNCKILSRHGYVVYAEDHRGHGKTGKSLDNMGYFGKADGIF